MAPYPTGDRPEILTGSGPLNSEGHGGVAMERIETKTKIPGGSVVKGKPVVLYAVGHKWQFTEDEIDWIRDSLKATLPGAHKRRKDIDDFIQGLQRRCSEKILALEDSRDPRFKPLNKADLDRALDICEAALHCLWTIQGDHLKIDGSDYLFVGWDESFVLEAKQRAEVAMRFLSPFVWLLAKKLFKSKRGRKVNPHVSFIRAVIDLYKKHIKEKPTREELKETVQKIEAEAKKGG